MATNSRIAVAIAVFMGFSVSGTSDLTAQGTSSGAGQAGIGVVAGGAPGLSASSFRRRYPLEFEVQIDAMAFINEWRAAQRYSQIETPARSGVRVNGTRVGARNSERQVLFACTGSAFLDLTFGIHQPDGSVRYDEGPTLGCDPKQALVLKDDKLACNWYSSRSGRLGVSVSSADAEIVLSTVPPVSIVGQCITGAATVVPAIVFPQGRGLRFGGRAPCAGSGVVVNGRATGQSANCGK